MIDKIIFFPYYLTLLARNRLYSSGRKKSCKAEIPTICVGNVTAGGTGKTPHVEMILRMLLESDEWGARNIAVLSRGYKRKSSGFQQVTRDGSAAMFGDEPLQIKRKFPVVTVAVDKDRIEGADFLAHPNHVKEKKGGRKCLDRNFPASDIIVLDDAYQYRRLKADKNIVLVDYYRPVWKDRLLPLGRLRDLPSRVLDADVVIVTKCPCELEDEEKAAFAKGLGIEEFDPRICVGKACCGHGRKKSCREIKLFFTGIRYGRSHGVYSTSDPRYFYSKRLILVTGIAKDTPLRNYLSDYYKIERRFSFPDHHVYTDGDIRKIRSCLKLFPTAAIATTEKDAQRILDYTGMPETMVSRMFYIPIEVDFLSDVERELFRAWLVR